MKIQIEYPLIFGNDLCDGTWHDATVEELYLVGTGPFYLLKYFDEKYGEGVWLFCSVPERTFAKRLWLTTAALML